MLVNKQLAQVKPGPFEIVLYCIVCFMLCVLLQLYFHYKSHIRFAELQCNSLLQRSTLDFTYRNEAGVRKHFEDVESTWLDSWELINVAQGYKIHNSNRKTKTAMLPLITVSCTQQQGQYLKLTLVTQIALLSSENLFILFSSSIVTGLLLSFLIRLRRERQAINIALSGFFHEIDLHRNSPHLIETDTHSSIAELIDHNKMNLLNYLDTLQHRLQRVDEDFTEQLIQHNRDLEERYAYLEIQNRELQQLTTKKSTFFANLSHDFRTPLYTIEGYLRLLNEAVLSPEQRSHIRAIESANKSLSELVTNFLSMSRLEAGRMTIEHQAVDLRKLLREIIDSTAFLLLKNNNFIMLDISPSLDGELTLDGNKLRQILTNLITNAVKYTTGGVIYVHCHGNAVDEDAIALTISVADTGRGIPENEVKTIFDPYIRLERDRTKIPGTGLGLGICKELCEIINASLEVKSEVDIGTVFTVNLLASGEYNKNKQPKVIEEQKRKFVLFCSNSALLQYATQMLDGHELVFSTTDADELVVYASNSTAYDYVVALIDNDSHSSLQKIASAKLNPENTIISLCADELEPELSSLAELFNILPPILSEPILRSAALEPDTGITGSHRQPLAQSLRGYTILLAEDNDLNRFIIEDGLRKLGAKVISCADGAAALDLYRAGTYSLILIDAHMPKLSGTEVTEIIRKDFHDHETAIIGITASTSSTEYQHFIESGMSDCLIKPLKDDELIDVITRLGTQLSDNTDDKSSYAEKSAPADAKQNNIETLPNKLDKLIDTGLKAHILKIRTLLQETQHPISEIFHEIHRLNGTLSMGSYAQTREQCEMLEAKLRELSATENSTLSREVYEEIVQLADSIEAIIN